MSLRISLGPDQSFRLEIPSTIEGGIPSSVIIPQTLEGLRFLRRTLLARRFEREQRCGTKAAPTQDMVRAFLAAQPKKEVEKPSPPIADFSALSIDIVLDLGEL